MIIQFSAEWRIFGCLRKVPVIFGNCRSYCETFVQGKCLTFEALALSKRNYQKCFSNRMQFDMISVERRICRMPNYHNVMSSRVSLPLRTSPRRKCNTNFVIFSKQKQFAPCFVLVKIWWRDFKRELHIKANEPFVSGWHILK